MIYSRLPSQAMMATRIAAALATILAFPTVTALAQTKAPVAQFWMDVATNSMSIPGMGDMESGEGAMFGGTKMAAEHRVTGLTHQVDRDDGPRHGRAGRPPPFVEQKPGYLATAGFLVWVWVAQSSGSLVFRPARLPCGWKVRQHETHGKSNRSGLPRLARIGTCREGEKPNGIKPIGVIPSSRGSNAIIAC